MVFNETIRGLLAGILAFSIWGLLPLYWKLLSGVPAYEILCHRILWTFILTAVVLAVYRKPGELREVFTSMKLFIQVLCSGILIGANWLLYIWGVNAGYVVECSLGYYINPLVNVLLGFIFFRERLRPVQWFALILACCGVANQLIIYGSLPWIALVLAFSFGLYGLSRKTMKLGPVSGLFMETAVLVIPGLFFLTTFLVKSTGTFGQPGMMINLLLIGCGIVTSAPLILFAYCIKRVQLSTIGLLQYIGPTGMLLLGIFVFKEPFTTGTFVTFAFIWAGVILYSIESVLQYKRVTQQLKV